MAEKSVHTKKTLARWQQGRFGMFIHWGLYSAGNLDCWKINDMGIPAGEYAKELEPKFTGKKFNAAAVVKLAKDAGCKYIVMGISRRLSFPRCMERRDGILSPNTSRPPAQPV